MKSRALEKLLNYPNYIIADFGDYIGIGSSLCHKLIKLTKKDLEISYALDAFHKGKSALDYEPLIFIWEKLEELISTGEIHDIINGNDDLEEKITVYFFDENHIIQESYTDKLGWPNTTFDGKLMYDNVFFPTREEAVNNEISELKCSLDIYKESLNEKLQSVEKLKDIIQKKSDALNRLQENRK